MEKSFRKVADYKLLLPALGEGSNGTVFIAVDPQGKKFAAKRYDTYIIENNHRKKEYFKRELKLMSQLSHPNIIKIYDLRKTKNHLYFFLELCDGTDLESLIRIYYSKFSTLFSEKLIQFFTRQLVSGLYYMANNNSVHRDLKLENIMFTFNTFTDNTLLYKPEFEVLNIPVEKSLNTEKQFNSYDDFNFKNITSKFFNREQYEEFIMKSKLKLIDLGFARELNSEGEAKSILGTPITMAPEIWNRRVDPDAPLYGKKIDVWSLGCIIYNLLTGQPPFLSHDTPSMYNKIKKGDYCFPDNIKVSVELLDLINRLLQNNPENRIEWDDILTHPFLKRDITKFKAFVNNNILPNKNGEICFSTYLKYNLLNKFDINIDNSVFEIDKENKLSNHLDHLIENIFSDECIVIEIEESEVDGYILLDLINKSYD